MRGTFGASKIIVIVWIDRIPILALDNRGKVVAKFNWKQFLIIDGLYTQRGKHRLVWWTQILSQTTSFELDLTRTRV